MYSQAQLRAKGFLCWVNGLLFSVGLMAASGSLLKVLQASCTVALSLTDPQGMPLGSLHGAVPPSARTWGHSPHCPGKYF